MRPTMQLKSWLGTFRCGLYSNVAYNRVYLTTRLKSWMGTFCCGLHSRITRSKLRLALSGLGGRTWGPPKLRWLSNFVLQTWRWFFYLLALKLELCIGSIFSYIPLCFSSMRREHFHYILHRYRKWLITKFPMRCKMLDPHQDFQLVSKLHRHSNPFRYSPLSDSS